jgi:hypothetical protein
VLIDQILFPDLDAGSLRWKHQQDRVSPNLKTPSSRWFGLYITAALGAIDTAKYPGQHRVAEGNFFDPINQYTLALVFILRPLVVRQRV